MVIFRHLGCFIAIAALLPGSGCTRRHAPPSTDSIATPSREDTFNDSTYLNTRPHVRYVDDDACTDCHATIAQSFRQHPMGQSLATVHEATRIEQFDEQAQNPLVTNHFRYESRHQDDSMLHIQSSLGAVDRRVTRDEQPIAYVVGSGQRGRSYLVNHDGFLFMSPLTWYPRRGIWDLSPGYEKNDLEFNRPVLEDCLFCHANRANLREHMKNRYADPVFAGHAIGCQRCHGPGELHVERHKRADLYVGTDKTIVNPARLKPRLREAVCQQCHLSGVARVVRRRRSRYDYRPGTPLESSLATYVLRPDPQRLATRHFVGQVEQMYASRCFQASDGQLGCISCHDPHALPEREDRARYFRQRCLRCHATTSCSAPPKTRRDEAGGDNCVACHMPPMSTDVQHASTTDHRIRRLADHDPADTTDLPAIPRGATDLPVKPRGVRLPIVAFPPRPADGDEIDESRNVAIALLRTLLYHPRRVTRFHLQKVRGPLRQAVSRDPGDFPAKEALADIQRRLGRPRAAADLYREVLAVQPDREHSLVMFASVLGALGEFDEAVKTWEKAVRLNPWMARYFAELGLAYSRAGHWQKCLVLTQSALETFPTNVPMRRLLIEGLLHTGDGTRAEAQLAELLQLRPDEVVSIRDWFDNHPRRQVKGTDAVDLDVETGGSPVWPTDD